MLRKEAEETEPNFSGEIGLEDTSETVVEEVAMLVCASTIGKRKIKSKKKTKMRWHLKD